MRTPQSKLILANVYSKGKDINFLIFFKCKNMYGQCQFTVFVFINLELTIQIKDRILQIVYKVGSQTKLKGFVITDTLDSLNKRIQ